LLLGRLSNFLSSALAIAHSLRHSTLTSPAHSATSLVFHPHRPCSQSYARFREISFSAAQLAKLGLSVVGVFAAR
jgi:hypothetical protein